MDKIAHERYIRIQRTRNYDDLPGNIKSRERYQRSKKNNELWLEESRTVIKTQDIIRQTAVWIKDDISSEPSSFEFSIQEIIYTFNGHQKVRHISLQHKLPAEYVITPQTPPIQNMKHYKFFIDLYYDDFGAFNKAYHKLGGIYVQIGNMNKELRKKLKNHFLIGFVPFGGEFKDTLKEFISDMKELQDGIAMEIKDEKVWVTAGFRMATADLPQGNDMAGIKRQNAEYGCRACKVPQDQLADINFDIIQNGRYHHLINKIYDDIKAAKNNTVKKRIAKEHGVCLTPNILDELSRDRHIQIPHDPFHCLAGLARRLFEHIFKQELERSGLEAFNNTWRSFEIPNNWKRLQSPINHFESYWMSDSLRLVMIMPFILLRCLDISYLKQDFANTVKENCLLTNLRQVKGEIIKTWSLFAKVCAKVFANEFLCESTNDYYELDQLLLELVRKLNKVINNCIYYL